MKFKKLGILTVAIFVVNWVTNFLIHGVILKSTYQATANLWRPESDMKQYCVYMFGGQFLVALFFSWIFIHGYKGKGWKEGVRYGLLIGAYNAGQNLIMYAVSPWEFSLVASWIFFCFLQCILAGVVATFVYKA